MSAWSSPGSGTKSSCCSATGASAGTIAEILPVSDVYAGTQPLLGRDRLATQIARIRFNPGAVPPALNSSVYVHMYYTELASRTAVGLVGLLGLH